MVTVLSERIRTTLKTKGYSHGGFATDVGVTQQTVSKWASGESRPSMNNVVAIAQVLKEDSDDWLATYRQALEEANDRSPTRTKKRFEQRISDLQRQGRRLAQDLEKWNREIERLKNQGPS